MSRFLTSLGILLGLILISITSLLVLGCECRQYAACAGDAAYACSHGDTPAALDAFDRLDGGWEHFQHVTGLFADGDKLDAIRSRMIALRPLIEAGNPDVSAELERIRQLIGNIYEEEIPVLWHIL